MAYLSLLISPGKSRRVLYGKVSILVTVGRVQVNIRFSIHDVNKIRQCEGIQHCFPTIFKYRLCNGPIVNSG